VRPEDVALLRRNKIYVGAKCVCRKTQTTAVDTMLREGQIRRRR
jgi:hypothetical protein